MKGITPIIATVLLLMMTVAAAGAAYVWMNSLQEQVRQQVEGSSSLITGQSQMQVDVRFKLCNSTSNAITVFLQNSGGVSIDKGNIGLTLKNNDGVDIEFTENSTAMTSSLAVNTYLSVDFAVNTNLVSGTNYILNVIMPGGTTTSALCSAID